MKGDFSRFSFDRTRHFSAVRMQQGRVQLDADWNEQADILEHLGQAVRVDLFGNSGTPVGHEGFQISTDASAWPDEAAAISNNLKLSAGPLNPLMTSSRLTGRYYVNGVLCEIEPHPTREDGSWLVTTQPDLPSTTFETDVADAGVDDQFLLYLDVWQREISALEDPHIVEPALGGADSATRSRTVWQVRAYQLQPGDEGLPLDAFGVSWLPAPLLPATGMLAAGTVTVQTSSTDPSITPALSGYRGLENLLYRVEIHSISEPGTSEARATFKWSQNNAFLRASVTGMTTPSGSPPSFVLTCTGFTSVQLREFQPGQLLELTDESRIQSGQPGVLVMLLSPPQSNQLTVTWAEDGQTYTLTDSTVLIPWDCTELIEVEQETWFPLGDNGVQVSFSTTDGNAYRVGNYWQIAARAAINEDTIETAVGSILWPLENGEPRQLPPMGIEHQYCALAQLQLVEDTEVSGNTVWSVVADLRRHFPSITDMAALHYVSGERQEGTANGWLEEPLSVGLAYGPTPISGAGIRFTVTDESGGLAATSGSTAQSSFDALTDEDGIARAYWKLGATPSTQHVRAQWVQGSDTLVGLPVVFAASIASGSVLKTFTSLEDMLAVLNEGELGVLDTYDPTKPLLSVGWTLDTSNALNRVIAIQSDQQQVYYIFFDTAGSNAAYLRSKLRSNASVPGSSWGSNGKTLGENDSLRALAVDGSGVYASQLNQSGTTYRLQKWSPAGTSLATTGELGGATRALYSDGFRVYSCAESSYSYADQTPNLLAFDTNLTVQWQKTLASTPRGICTDGELLLVAGRRQVIDGETTTYYGAVDALYYSSTTAAPAVKWTKDLLEGSSASIDITSICCDQEFVYVSGFDGVDKIVWAIDKVGGNLVWQLSFGNVGISEGSIACDGQYVYSSTNNKLYILHKQGHQIYQLSTTNDLAVDADGDALFIAGPPAIGGGPVLTRLNIRSRGQLYKRVNETATYRVPFHKKLIPLSS